MSWDGFQRDVLAELGLAAYVLAGTSTAAVQTIMPPSPVGDDVQPPLLRALLRAAAADHAHADVLALCQQFLAAHPQPSVQARRALWPTLRRLRRLSVA